MKNQMLKIAITTASLVIGMSKLGLAHADTFAGQNLGFAAGTTDVYGVTCPIGTAPMKAQVNDAGGADGIEMSVQVIGPHGRAATETAPDGGGFSATAVLPNSHGQYLVSVHKDNVGVEGYTVQMECFTGGNIPIAGIQSTLIQDQ